MGRVSLLDVPQHSQCYPGHVVGVIRGRLWQTGDRHISITDRSDPFPREHINDAVKYIEDVVELGDQGSGVFGDVHFSVPDEIDH